ncbi:hypothetical protein PFISCL1PPCAC_7463, partial [Pristionchus fissidentatus]
SMIYSTGTHSTSDYRNRRPDDRTTHHRDSSPDCRNRRPSCDTQSSSQAGDYGTLRRREPQHSDYRTQREYDNRSTSDHHRNRHPSDRTDYRNRESDRNVDYRNHTASNSQVSRHYEDRRQSERDYRTRRRSGDSRSYAEIDHRSDNDRRSHADKKDYGTRPIDNCSSQHGSDTQSSSYADRSRSTRASGERRAANEMRVNPDGSPFHPWDARPMNSIEMAEMESIVLARVRDGSGQLWYPRLAREWGTEIPSKSSRFDGRPIRWIDGPKCTMYYYSPELHTMFPVSDEEARGWLRDSFLTGASHFATMRPDDGDHGMLYKLSKLLAEDKGVQAFAGYLNGISEGEIDLQSKVNKTMKRREQLEERREAFQMRHVQLFS